MIKKNEGFKCVICEAMVLPLNNGSCRNHCPYCLVSLHLDVIPGDRRSACKGVMMPLRLEYNSKKGYQIIHKCEKCNVTKKNKIAENCTQPDDMDKLIILSSMGGAP